ncbi:hypothetical protein SNE40_001666 [Patella caerulea]|uniref:Uncharacterized protein n=1 Tax=Patella caerulea TaxID=87958 RepID=A0AAN8K7K3_PATCE
MANRGEIEEKVSRGTEFSAWEEIQACLETLKTFGIIYSIHRGDKLMFDSPCVYSHVKLRCKFGIRMQYKVSFRSHQRYYGALQCNSRICIRYNKLTLKLRIVHSSFDHKGKDGITHVINEETAGHIPELRRLDDTQKGFIDSIDSLGVPS